MSILDEIAERMRGQDTAATAHPLYVVEQDEKIYWVDATEHQPDGYETHLQGDEERWWPSDADGRPINAASDPSGKPPKGELVIVPYIIRRVPVEGAICLSRSEAERHIREAAHRYNNPGIFVASAKIYEMRELIDELTAEVPSRGLLTWRAEGQECGRYHSRRPHWPGGGSGVTIGRGYDMRWRSGPRIAADLAAAGVGPKLAVIISAAAGLQGTEAGEVAGEMAERAIEITPRQQQKLFEATYAEAEADVRRISELPEVVAAYGTPAWDDLDAAVMEVAIDLRFRGDYTPTKRRTVQAPIAANDRGKLLEVMRDRDLWKSVPDDRFRMRIDTLAAWPWPPKDHGRKDRTDAD